LLPVVAFILVGVRPGMIAAGMSLLSLIVFTYMATAGYLEQWLIYPQSPLDLESWLTEIVPTGMVIVIIMLLLYSMNTWLMRNLYARQEALMRLKQVQSQLDDMQQTLEERVLQRTTMLEVRVKDLEELNNGDHVPRSILVSLSHEIRSNVNSVMGMTNLLLDTDLSDEQIACTHAIRTNSEALLTAVSKTLEFPEAGEGKDVTEEIGTDEYHFYLLELINTYLENTPILLNELKTAIESGNNSAVRSFAYDLEKSSGEFGATELIEKARELEVIGREQDLSGAAEKYEQIEEAYHEVQQTLEKRKASLLIN
jgi:signal transduction histidine kinase